MKIENLAIQIGTGASATQPVSAVSLSIEAGRSVGVVGESGSGKSLTALAVMGLLPPRSRAEGRILWNGRNLLSLSENEMREVRGREIAMIFQDPMSSLNPSFTIGFQISEVLQFKLGIKNRKSREERGLRLLNDVGISAPAERWKSYPHQLSGGMCQRVCIAMALACEPKLLIADEPTTALDVTVQMQILSLLSRIKKERGMSMFFVTHDLAVAGKVCDEISVFYKGQSIEHGRSDLMLTTPTHRYTQALLMARPSSNQQPRSELKVSVYE